MVLLRSFIPPRTAGAPRPSFAMLGASVVPGVDNLPPELTSNSTTVTPFFRYKGGDANATNWTAWGYGETVNLSAAGSVAFDQLTPGMGDNDLAVKMDGSNYYQHTGSSFGDVTTEDLVFEFIIKISSSGANEIICDKSRTTANVGWAFWRNTAKNVFVGIKASAAVSVATGSALAGDTWYHCMCFINRNENSTNGVKLYINGKLSNSANFSAQSASISGSDKLTIGSRSDGALWWYQDTIAYLAGWKQSDWHAAGAAGPTEWAQIAEERFMRFCGVYPTRAAGTALPTTRARSSSAFLDKLESGVRTLYMVGDNWLRVVDRNDKNGVNIVGYLSEQQSTNLCLNSEDVSSIWNKETAGDSFDLNAATAPDGKTTADGLIANNSNVEHGVNQTVSGITTTVHTMSCWAKAGDKDWVHFHNATLGAQATCWFDIATPAVGTKGAAIIDACVEDWGNGWTRMCATFSGTAASHVLQFHSAEDDLDEDFQGDNATVNTYLWGCQVEAMPHMTSYIPTTSASVTRAKDTLTFKGDDGNIRDPQGTVACDTLLHDIQHPGDAYMWAVSDGASNADKITLSVDSNNNPLAISTATAGSNGRAVPNVDIADNAIHSLRTQWITNAFKQTADTTPDTDATMSVPNDLDQIDVGMDEDNTNQLNGVISNFRLFPKNTGRG